MAYPIIGLVIILFLPAIRGCPETMPPPCECTPIGFHTSTVVCSGAENEIDLQKSLYAVRNTPIRTMTIMDSTMNYLPSDLFEGIKFENLHLATSTFMSLSDTDAAFVGLEDSLKNLKVQECTLLLGWDWHLLSNLTALTEINAIKSGPLEIDEDIKDIAHLNIDRLYLTRDSLSFIHDEAFSTFHNLRILSLKDNAIPEMKRSMFPDPALKLVQVILSYNELKTLPVDMFANMPNLTSITLRGNHFLTLDKNIYAPVWSQLSKLDIAENPLRCDCRMKWMIGISFPKNGRGTCEEPPSLKGKPIQELVGQDLIC